MIVTVGFIFYANIAAVNRAVLFPSSESSLAVFVAWLNLVDTCIIDGLDAYIKTWLQLAFSIYYYVISLFIIVII